MSILMEVLAEELDRLNRQEIAYKNALKDYPRGYISKKNIHGKIYYYLQYKEKRKVVGQYISAANLPALEAQLQKKKQVEASLRRVKEDQKKLRKILGVKDV